MSNASLLEKGKVQPQAIMLEEAVLGAMMIDKSGLDIAVSMLKEKYFYSITNQSIYKAIQRLYDSNSPVDILTVSEKLKQLNLLNEGVIDRKLIELSSKVGSSAHIKYHCVIIQHQYIKRKVIEISSLAIEKSFEKNTTASDLIEYLETSLDKLSNVTSSDYVSQSWYDAITELPKHIEFLSNRDGEITGLPTGLDALDKHFSGWQPTDFIVIGADSGMGKTALSMKFLLTPAKQDIPVGMLSMEMSVKQLSIRATAVESNFHMNQLMRTGFEKSEYFVTLNLLLDKMREYPIHIDDKPSLTVSEMKRKARYLKRKHGIKLLVIDFLQMFSGDQDIRINVGEAARECKNIAKELNIAVIALSQISREVRKSKYFLPKKYHLKEASAIEEAADVIGMLYRPAYYGYDYENYKDLYDNILGLKAEENTALLVEKFRNGSLGTVGLRYIENKTKFVNGTSNEQHFI
jgi:replicative DNA helicase